MTETRTPYECGEEKTTNQFNLPIEISVFYIMPSIRPMRMR